MQILRFSVFSLFEISKKKLWLTNSAILDSPTGDLKYSEPDISSSFKDPINLREEKIQ